MATKKTATDERFSRQDFDLFEALTALDRKDYDWWDTLSEEQQRRWVPYMMCHWLSSVKTGGALGAYYVLNTDAAANRHLFNETISGHPQLQWLMMCAVSPGRGKQFHQWIPHLGDRIGQLRSPATHKEVVAYYEKVYTSASKDDIDTVSKQFVQDQNKRYTLGQFYPHMKLDDIEILSQVISESEIQEYRDAHGQQ